MIEKKYLILMSLVAVVLTLLLAVNTLYLRQSLADVSNKIATTQPVKVVPKDLVKETNSNGMPLPGDNLPLLPCDDHDNLCKYSFENVWWREESLPFTITTGNKSQQLVKATNDDANGKHNSHSVWYGREDGIGIHIFEVETDNFPGCNFDKTPRTSEIKPDSLSYSTNYKIAEMKKTAEVTWLLAGNHITDKIFVCEVKNGVISGYSSIGKIEFFVNKPSDALSLFGMLENIQLGSAPMTENSQAN